MVYEDMELAKAMFGRELLDVPQFWADRYELDTNGEKVFRVKGDRNGKIASVAEGGKPVVLETGYYKHRIDYNKVQGNKTELYKMLVKGMLAAQLYAHKTAHSTDPRYDPQHFEAILDAMSKIPAGTNIENLEDLKDFRNLRVNQWFFTKKRH